MLVPNSRVLKPFPISGVHPSHTPQKAPKIAMLSKRLRERRLELNMTQNELADAAGVDQSQIWKYESGRTFPGADRLLTLCHVLDVSADWLLGIEPPDALTPDEAALLSRYRALSPEARAVLQDVARLLR